MSILRKCSYPIFYAGLYIAYLSVLFASVTLPDLHRLSHTLVRIGAPVVELGMGYLFCTWAKRQGPMGRISAIAVALAYVTIYVAQIFSLYIADSFISVLAIENREEGRLIRTTGLYLSILAGCVWWLMLVAWEAMDWHRSRHAPPPVRGPAPSTPSSKRFLAGYALFVILLLGEIYLGVTQRHDKRLEVGFLQVPVANLMLTLHRLYRADDVRLVSSKSGVTATTTEATIPFAYQKDWIYKKPFPFDLRDTVNQVRPNVIVIFTEGMSARLIGAYGGKHRRLTPRIDRFAKQSMQVVNYFNHTAATYRGLQGQMQAGYPLAGGSGDTYSWETKGNSSKLAQLSFASLPMILGQRGYTTRFISPHPDSVALNTMIRSLGFDEVYSPDTVRSMLGIKFRQTIAGGSITDHTLFEALQRVVETQAGAGHPPLFVGVYNIGTHAFLDSRPGGLTYGDGSNQVLNRFHNYDHAVGRFLSWFMASPYASNTILIFTSDHATFPDKYFHAAEGASTQPFFLAPIPLLIHDPFHKLPKRFDAHGATSAGFAPMVLQMLDIASAPNSFLGRSIFDGAADLHYGVAAIGKQYFLTTVDGVYPDGQVPPVNKSGFLSAKHDVQMYYREQQNNTVFSRQRGEAVH
jgi:phosphoglycerol transferase MdoB-like AlkP superfamily enzyme